jgi:hypothetical protein
MDREDQGLRAQVRAETGVDQRACRRVGCEAVSMMGTVGVGATIGGRGAAGVRYYHASPRYKQPGPHLTARAGGGRPRG